MDKKASFAIDTAGYRKRLNLALDDLPAFLRVRYPAYTALPKSFQDNIDPEVYQDFQVPTKYGRLSWFAGLVNSVLNTAYTPQAIQRWLSDGVVPELERLTPLCHQVLFVRQEWLVANLGPMREPLIAQVAEIVAKIFRRLRIRIPADKQTRFVRELYKEFWG